MISIEDSLKKLINNLRNILLKLMVLLLVIYGSIRCSSPKEKHDHSEEMKEALIFFIDSMLYKDYGDSFLISPKFLKDLSKEEIKGLNTDSILTKEDLQYMAKQYTKYKEMKVNDFINGKYDSLITLDQPNKDQFYFVLSPPLFSRDNKYLLFYEKAFFKVNNKYRWDNLLLLFRKKKNNWELIGLSKNKHYKNI